MNNTLHAALSDIGPSRARGQRIAVIQSNLLLMEQKLCVSRMFNKQLCFYLDVFLISSCGFYLFYLTTGAALLEKMYLQFLIKSNQTQDLNVWFLQRFCGGSLFYSSAAPPAVSSVRQNTWSVSPPVSSETLRTLNHSLFISVHTKYFNRTSHLTC